MNKMNNRERLRRNQFLNEDIKGQAKDQHRGNAKTAKENKRRRISVAATIIFDVLIAALALYIFSLYYFLLPQDLSHNAKALPGAAAPKVAISAPVNTQTPSVSDEVSPAAIQDASMWGAKFPGKFTDGEVQKTKNSYKSANINVNIDKVQTEDVTYYVADIYIKDLKFFKTAFAKGKYGKGLHDGTDVMAKENNAILAINGDYYGNNAGPVVRNGVLYRDEKYKDVLVMNYDGSMQTLTSQELDMEKVKTEGVYQIWTFGPMLLQAGEPMTAFNSDLTRANPRTAIGYYEPGHYCFVLVDGRQPGYSNGMTMQQMSALFYNLGCSVAYNLDGGQSSEMVFQNEFVNQPYKGGRNVSDIVYIAEE